MKGIVKVWVVAAAMLTVPSVWAGSVTLKSGKVVEGRVLERTATYVRLDCEGVPVSYFIEELDAIDGEKVAPPEPKAPAAPAAVSAPEPASVPAAPEAAPAAAAVSETPFKTAVIKYRATGVIDGNEVVYVDLKKNKAARESWVTKRLGSMSRKEHRVEIYDGKAYVTLDFDKKEGLRQKMEGDLIAVFFDEDAYRKFPATTEKFLGRDCRVYKTPMGKVYFWNRLRLKEDVTSHPMGDSFNYTREAVDVQLDVPVPAEAFSEPGGFHMMTGEEVGRQLEQMFQQSCPLNRK